MTVTVLMTNYSTTIHNSSLQRWVVPILHKTERRVCNSLTSCHSLAALVRSSSRPCQRRTCQVQICKSDKLDCQRNYGVETTYHVGAAIPFRALSQACALLAIVFGHHDEIPEHVQFSNYTIRLIAALQSRAMVETSGFVLFMSHQLSTDALAGVVTISKGLDAAGACGHSIQGAMPGYTVYSLCNMAVKSSFRRQGIATYMLERVEEYLQGQHEHALLVLSVEKYNIEAQRLYERLGYRVDESWIDPRWLESVEKDRIDVPRRILMIKHV